MMLGVDLNRCTLLHSCEDMSNVPYIIPSVPVAPPVGRPDIITLKNYPPGHRAFIHLMEAMRQKPWFTQGYIGEARTLIFPIKAMYDHCMEALRDDPFHFLCENNSCNSCALIRRKMTNPHINTGACPETYCEVCAFQRRWS